MIIHTCGKAGQTLASVNEQEAGDAISTFHIIIKIHIFNLNTLISLYN